MIEPDPQQTWESFADKSLFGVYLRDRRDVYCPACGCRESLGEPPGSFFARCNCGLLWTVDRRRFGHYAVLLNSLQAEKLRDKAARRLTKRILARMAPTTDAG